ncbi:MAG TPA: ATP-binding protein [Candidatus Atribacteria bacterium]|nr:ATP-binding protein [Candidatus Atribacteria bacterium]
MERKSKNYEEVPIEKLRWKCNLSSLKIKTTDDLKPSKNILGQERALKAIKLGLEMEYLGYNLFVTGKAGTGRSTTIKMLLEGRKREGIEFDDKCYVNNFKNPDMPRAINLPAGQGKIFKKDMESLISSLRKKIPLIFESKRYQANKKSVIGDLKNKQKEMVKKFEKRVNKENFTLVQIQMGIYTKPEILPIITGKPINLDKLESMVESKQFPEKDFKTIQKKYNELSSQLSEISKEISNLEKDLCQKLSSLDYKMVSPMVEELISELKEKYKNKKINLYLDEIKESILNNIEKFQGKKEKEAPAIPGLVIRPPKNNFKEYEVNVLVDNSETKNSPVIIETIPSYKNLFGTIERNLDKYGHWITDFTRIKAGSLLRANGGFLVLNALDTLIEPGVWPALKRTLLNRKIITQTYDPFYMFTTSALKPEPIECDTKVIMIGDPFLYYLLYSHDEDFKKIFKVRADFDSVTQKDNNSIYQYACFIQNICQREKLRPFDKSGLAVAIEYAVRLAGKQNKLSTQFNNLVDVLREANYWAKKDNNSVVTEKCVDKAITEKIERLRLIEEKIQEMIEEGTIMIDCKGMVNGQVNGLSLYDLGEYSFGKPTRITAKTSMGRAGIINIEREADLSGKTHNKGVLILSGYLRAKYAQNKPLTVSASICFEQSYTGVEGDSASSTEVYALLSSLADLPLRQDIAVTGSINQKGEIQPIGGVNQKIEGFYEVCKAKGFTGTQGVIIPSLNISDLMLRKDVVEAIKEGKFHIYPVETIDQGIEILTGVKAGKIKADGTFEEDTVNYLVDKKLAEFANKLKEFSIEMK